MIIGNEKALYLLFLVPLVLVPVLVWCMVKKHNILRKFADLKLLKTINDNVSTRQQIFKGVLVISAFIFLVIALSEPKWNPKPRHIRRKGRDVVILLDVSRSMLAGDLKPSRLEKSKLAILDLLEELNGGRLAIVTFAGSSTVKCPLTQDYAFVRMVIDEITTESTPRGGTMIGDAIREATDKVFDKASRKYKDIILITDGEDHDSFAKEAAAKAVEKGIRIISIGLGDVKEGARIPVIDEKGQKKFLKYKGKEIWSKHNSELLKQVALTSSDGRYLSVRPGTSFDLGQIYRGLIQSAEKKEIESVAMTKYEEKFQIFIVIALILTIGEVFISERRKN